MSWNAVYEVLRRESRESTELDPETRLLIEKELGAAPIHLEMARRAMEEKLGVPGGPEVT